MNHHVKEPSVTVSFLASVLVHGLVVAGVLFLAKPTPLPDVVSMQASLVDNDSLADIQGQIAAAYAKNQAKNQISTDNISTASDTPTSDYQDLLAEREQAYQEQMKLYAEALDQEFISEQQAYLDALSADDLERQKQVQALKQRERSNDEIARENARTLNHTQEPQKSQQSKSADSSSDDTPTPPTVNQGGQVGGSTSGDSHSTGDGVSQSQIVSALQAHIKRHWQPLGTNARLSVRLKVDAQGNVQSVQVSGGTPALQDALEDTIKRASPLTPIEGTNYRNLNFAFNIN